MVSIAFKIKSKLLRWFKKPCIHLQFHPDPLSPLLPALSNWSSSLNPLLFTILAQAIYFSGNALPSVFTYLGFSFNSKLNSRVTPSERLSPATWYKWPLNHLVSQDILSFSIAENYHYVTFSYLFIFESYCLPFLYKSRERLYKKRDFMHLVHLHIPKALELGLAYS